jgi:hypothetical protein
MLRRRGEFRTFRPFEGQLESASQKIQKRAKSLLTPKAAADYIPLHNEGGTPLASLMFALVSEIKRAA